VLKNKDTLSGDIIQNAIVCPNHGIITSKMSAPYVVDSTNKYSFQNYFTVRFDEGEKIPVDFTKYKIMCYPTDTDCSSTFDRNVTIDNAAQKVTYKITITHCDDCEGNYTAENWVLVPIFPSDYKVVHEVSYINNVKKK
jgi:hypothetical protein